MSSWSVCPPVADLLSDAAKSSQSCATRSSSPPPGAGASCSSVERPASASRDSSRRSAREASATHVVLTGRAVEGGGAYRPVADALVGALRAGLQVTPTSLGPYGAALARLLPDWTEVTGAASESGVDPGLVLGEAVARFLSLVGHGRPCLLVLEDLHWADADSWAVLAHVAVAVPSLPVLVVATMREDEPTAPAADPLTRLPGVVTLRLARLAQEDVHQLAASLGVTDPSTMTMLEERADGLPFMVEELVAVDPGDVPPTLRALVSDRFAKLDGDQRRVLAGAAVLGLTPDWSCSTRSRGSPRPTCWQRCGRRRRLGCCWSMPAPCAGATR